jgi:hypothetical protein
MLLSRYLAGGLASLAFLLAAAAARGEAPADPLRLVPDQADFFLEIARPRQLVEAGLSLEVVKTLQGLAPVQELYDSTNARRFYQLLAHFEKVLGCQWPEMLDQVAGGGIVVASRTGKQPPPALVVIQGKDEALVRKFFATGLKVIEEELARQESKERPEKGAYRDIEYVRIGKEFHAAVVGAALLVSNKGEALQLALDLHAEGGKKSLAQAAGVAGSRKLLPKNPLARLWLNLEKVKQTPQAKEIFTSPRNDPNLTVLFGGWIDVAARAPYLCAGLYQEKTGFLMTVRMPAGREGASADAAVHAPPLTGPAAPPLLEPKGVLFSTCFYLDLGKFWEERTRLFNPQQVKNLEDTDKNAGRFLVGAKLSQLLTQTGAYHRFVVVNQPKFAYAKAPAQPIPAFAFVMELRDPEAFARSMDTILRGAALLAGAQFKLKLVEEKRGEHTIVGYRFPEDVPVPADVTNARFAFSPCFLRVHNQFVFCSTMELARELVDLLDREAKLDKPQKQSPAAVRANLYGAGGAQALRFVEETLVTQIVLDQAVAPEEARKQVEVLIDVVRRLGVLHIESVYEAKQFRYDIRLTLGK